ncbi:hypothetical protein cyc_05828 [Cyclospora cayetanensis]|uniref:Uncharacterized protein n=1 Tax=Cyclospora cayetanensis TaxID=88456 RepID=A0A1D3CZ43_9EIME|nr:hypothetical protein cyc_05828 [Cyclospora cayetanensis]
MKASSTPPAACCSLTGHTESEGGKEASRCTSLSQLLSQQLLQLHPTMRCSRARSVDPCSMLEALLLLQRKHTPDVHVYAEHSRLSWRGNTRFHQISLRCCRLVDFPPLPAVSDPASPLACSIASCAPNVPCSVGCYSQGARERHPCTAAAGESACVVGEGEAKEGGALLRLLLKQQTGGPLLLLRQSQFFDAVRIFREPPAVELWGAVCFVAELHERQEKEQLPQHILSSKGPHAAIGKQETCENTFSAAPLTAKAAAAAEAFASKARHLLQQAANCSAAGAAAQWDAETVWWQQTKQQQQRRSGVLRQERKRHHALQLALQMLRDSARTAAGAAGKQLELFASPCFKRALAAAEEELQRQLHQELQLLEQEGCGLTAAVAAAALEAKRQLLKPLLVMAVPRGEGAGAA